MAKKTYTLLSGSVWAIQNAFGLITAPSWAAVPQHLDLRALFQFTEAEQVQVGWYEEVRPPGQVNRTGFTKDDLALTRQLTPSMCKKIAEVIQASATQIPAAYFARWLVPVLETIGHPMPAAVWEDEENE